MKKLKDGAKVELVVSKGSKDTNDYSERTLTGTLRYFEQIDRVYDEELIAIGKNTTTHWEILTDDPVLKLIHPAVGIVPENVVSIKEL